MGKSCLICNNKFEKGANVSFHTFPKDLEMKNKWCQILGISCKMLNKNDVICSNHFSPNDIKVNSSSLDKRHFLDKNAVPSLPSISGSVRVEKRMKFSVIDGYTSTENLSTRLVDISPASSSAFPVKSDISAKSSSTSDGNKPTSGTLTASEEAPNDVYLAQRFKIHRRKQFPRRAKRTWRVSPKTMKNRRPQILSLKRQVRRLKARLSSMTSLLNFLLSKNAETIIEVNR